MAKLGFDTLHKKNATVHDTLDLIVDFVNQYSNDGFAKDVVQKLSPITDRDKFLTDLFDYYCRNVEYILDPDGIEQVYTPARTIHEGKGDCKKAAIFLASILKAAGIEPVLKHVFYEDNDRYTHIYVIVPNPDLNNYITLDPTNNCQYNSEVKYNHGTLHFLNGDTMELRAMGYTDIKPENVNIGWKETVVSGTQEMLEGIDEVSENIGFKGRGRARRALKEAEKEKRLEQRLKSKSARQLHRQQKRDQTIPTEDQSVPTEDQSIPTEDQTQNVAPPSNLYQETFEQNLTPDTDQTVYTEDTDSSYDEGVFGPSNAKVLSDAKKLAPLLPGDKLYKLFQLQNIPLEQQRGAFLALIQNNVDGIANMLGAVLGTNIHAFDKLWIPLGGDITVLKSAIVEGAKKKPQSSGSIKGPEFIGKFNLAHFLHAASGILNSIAPVSNAIIPGAGIALKGVANKADLISSRFPVKDAFGKLMPPPAYYPTDTNLPPGVPVLIHGGSVMGSIGGFIFKSVLIISTLNINPILQSVLGTLAIVAPLTFVCWKKFKTWQISQHI